MTDDELLADLLLRWEELHEKGQEPAAEELCRDSPHLAPLLAERIHALKVTAWMEKPDDNGGIQTDPPAPMLLAPWPAGIASTPRSPRAVLPKSGRVSTWNCAEPSLSSCPRRAGSFPPSDSWPRLGGLRGWNTPASCKSST